MRKQNVENRNTCLVIFAAFTVILIGAVVTYVFNQACQASKYDLAVMSALARQTGKPIDVEALEGVGTMRRITGVFINSEKLDEAEADLWAEHLKLLSRLEVVDISQTDEVTELGRRRLKDLLPNVLISSEVQYLNMKPYKIRIQP